MTHKALHYITHHDPELVIDKVAKTAHGLSYIGAGGTVYSGLSLNEWGVVVGMCFTVLTYFTFLFFNIRKDKREEKALEKRLSNIKPEKD